MFLGYNTNGFAHHKLEDSIAILAGQGYHGIAITPDVHHLNPYSPSHDHELIELGDDLGRRGLKCVIETGARFLLNAHVKHQPTLISPSKEDRAYRFEFLSQDAIRIAAVLEADYVSFWSGSPTDDAAPSVLMDRLVEECRKLSDIASAIGVRLAFEPEPGMFIDTMDKFAELHGRVNHPSFGLTLDVGHLVCLGEVPPSKFILPWQGWLWNVHLDDMKTGTHDHLPIGDGSVDFQDVFQALKQISYNNGCYVELSRHSHNAVETAKKSLALLKDLL